MILHSHAYDSDYIPAMPLVEIVIGNIATSPHLSLKALVDSGVDGTIIPLTYLKQVGARKYQKKWLRSVTGQRAQVDLYQISIRMGSYGHNRLAVAGDPQLNEAIIGRDLLNHFIVTLNGLAGVVEIAQ